MFISTKLCGTKWPCILFTKHLDCNCDCFYHHNIDLILCTTTLSLILLRKAKRLKAVNNAEETDMGYVKTKLNEPDILIVRVEIAHLHLFINQ